MATTKAPSRMRSHASSGRSSSGSGEPTKNELMAKARDAGIKGRSSMRKDELMKALKGRS